MREFKPGGKSSGGVINVKESDLVGTFVWLLWQYS